MVFVTVVFVVTSSYYLRFPSMDVKHFATNLADLYDATKSTISTSTHINPDGRPAHETVISSQQPTTPSVHTTESEIFHDHETKTDLPPSPSSSLSPSLDSLTSSNEADSTQSPGESAHPELRAAKPLFYGGRTYYVDESTVVDMAKLRKVIVMAKRQREDTDWVANELPE